MQIAPSKNPEKESKQFSILGLVFGALGLFIWFLGIAGLAFSVRGLILSGRVKNRNQQIMSVVGLVLSLIALGYYFVKS